MWVAVEKGKGLVRPEDERKSGRDAIGGLWTGHYELNPIDDRAPWVPTAKRCFIANSRRLHKSASWDHSLAPAGVLVARISAIRFAVS